MVASVFLRIRILIAAALLLATVAAKRNTASAQSIADADTQKTETSDLVIHQNVRRVVVDVVVSDSSGKPVAGLNARDFSVTEDGKSQRVRSFDVHDFDSSADSLPKRPASLPTNTFVNLPSGPERSAGGARAVAEVRPQQAARYPFRSLRSERRLLSAPGLYRGPEPTRRRSRSEEFSTSSA